MKPRLTPDQKHMLRSFSIFVLIWAIFCAICLLLASCKSVRTEVRYDYRDSVITHHRYDTTRVTVRDTIRVDASSETYKEGDLEITFGTGGGTFNTQTGDATNVASVHQKSREKELQTLILQRDITIDSLHVENDSLRHALTEAQGEEHTQQNTADITPRNGWDRFCTWWTIGSWIVLLILLAYGIWRLYRKFALHI